MKAYLGFLLIPVAVASGLLAARWLPTGVVTAVLPSVQTLNVPLAPDAVPRVQLREPAVVDLRPLMPIDPPPARPVLERAALVLSAIYVDGDRRATQIGNQIYQKGDTLGNYRVERIEPMRVLLVSKGKNGERLWVDMSKGY